MWHNIYYSNLNNRLKCDKRVENYRYNNIINRTQNNERTVYYNNFSLEYVFRNKPKSNKFSTNLAGTLNKRFESYNPAAVQSVRILLL